MQKTKLMFSDAELQLALDVEVILTKNKIIQKVYDQFGTLGTLLFDGYGSLRKLYPVALNAIPKISKGENYEGMPWVMLDYPRCFNKKVGNFACRIFFRWGHYYLLQFQVSKSFLPDLMHILRQKKVPVSLFKYPIYVGYPEDPWNFQIPQAGLKLYNPDSFSENLQTDEIFKIAVAVPLNDFETLVELSMKLCNILSENWAPKPNFPIGEIIP